MDKKLKKINLNLQQEMFCQVFASNKEFFGNGTQSYLSAYDPDGKKKITYKSARARASLLLTSVNILERIDQLLDIYINDNIVDKNLAIVIIQNADFSSKVAAIKEYNQLKQRIIRKIDLTTGGESFFRPTEEEKAKSLKALEQLND